LAGCVVAAVAGGTGCSEGGAIAISAENGGAPVASSAVNGTIRGTTVNLREATFDGDLALFESEGWGWSPSLLIFLFLEDGHVPAGEMFTVQASSDFDASRPHVHYRWRGSGASIESDVAMDDYQMTLRFGQLEGAVLPGTIEFAIPGQQTTVSGSFRARVQ
jgi:hypothetical protein